MQKIKNFEFRAFGSRSGSPLPEALFDGNQYMLAEGEDYQVTSDELRATETNNFITKVKFAGQQKGKVIRCNKVGVADGHDGPSIIIQAEEATGEQLEKWAAQKEKMKATEKAKRDALKALKNAGNGADNGAASRAREHTAPAKPIAPAAKPVIQKKK